MYGDIRQLNRIHIVKEQIPFTIKDSAKFNVGTVRHRTKTQFNWNKNFDMINKATE
jgi:hypothetical protein